MGYPKRNKTGDVGAGSKHQRASHGDETRLSPPVVKIDFSHERESRRYGRGQIRSHRPKDGLDPRFHWDPGHFTFIPSKECTAIWEW